MIETVDAATLKRWLDAGEAVLVDVREAPRKRIPGAEWVPLSRLGPDTVPRSEGRRLVMHCEIGVASAEAVRRLEGAGLGPLSHLEGGIRAWAAGGLPVESAERKGPVSVQRQVQMVAGALVLLGTALGAAVSPWFLLVPAAMGAGLFLSGASGSCAMAGLLARLPSNRPDGVGSRAEGSG